jgi:transposase
VPKRYPEAFRRKVLDLVDAGRPVAQVAADLGISDQTMYGWRRQELIGTGQLPGLNRAELAELSPDNKRIRELETEVAVLKRARELLREPHDPKAVRGRSHYGRRVLGARCADRCRRHRGRHSAASTRDARSGRRPSARTRRADRLENGNCAVDGIPAVRTARKGPASDDVGQWRAAGLVHRSTRRR